MVNNYEYSAPWRMLGQEQLKNCVTLVTSWLPEVKAYLKLKAITSKSARYNCADFEVVRKIALLFPGTQECVSREHFPAIKVNGKLLCRLHDSGEFIPLRIGFNNRDAYLKKYPHIFHVRDHFKNYPYICMTTQHADVAILREIIEVSWKELASQNLITAWEAYTEPATMLRTEACQSTSQSRERF